MIYQEAVSIAMGQEQSKIMLYYGLQCIVEYAIQLKSICVSICSECYTLSRSKPISPWQLQWNFTGAPAPPTVGTPRSCHRGHLTAARGGGNGCTRVREYRSWSPTPILDQWWTTRQFPATKMWPSPAASLDQLIRLRTTGIEPSQPHEIQLQ